MRVKTHDTVAEERRFTSLVLPQKRIPYRMPGDQALRLNQTVSTAGTDVSVAVSGSRKRPIRRNLS